MAKHPGDITSDRLPKAPAGAQDADSVTHLHGDPNISGYAETGSTLDPVAGPLENCPDNEDYKDFALKGGKYPESRLWENYPEGGAGTAYAERDGLATVPPIHVERRDGGNHTFGPVGSLTGGTVPDRSKAK